MVTQVLLEQMRGPAFKWKVKDSLEEMISNQAKIRGWGRQEGTLGRRNQGLKG